MKSDFRNWSDIRVFLAVVREGSTLAASRLLDMSQPTVARRIEALEAETRLVLFDRDTRGFRPTQAARDLLPLAEQIETDAAAFGAKARELSEPSTIRVTAPGEFSDRVMDIISEFAALNPDVAIEIIPSVRVLDLAAGEADVAIRLTNHVADETLICRNIRTAKWALFGSRAYAEKHGLPASLDDLRGHRFVSFLNEDVPDDLHQWLIKRVDADQIVRSFRDVGLVQSSIRAGLGLGLVNLRQAQCDDALIRCSEDIEEISRQHLLLIAREAYNRPEVRAFTRFFAPRYAATFK